MASRSLGQLLLRPSALARIPHTSSTQCRRGPAPPSWTRPISHTPSQAAEPQRKDDAYNADYVPEESAQARPARSLGQRSPQPSQEETSQAIDSYFAGMPKTNRAPASYMPRGAPTSTAADRTARLFGADFSKAGRARPSLRPRSLDTDAMANPDMLNPTLANKPSEAASLAAQQEETFAQFPRLNPTYGRTVELDVKRGRDIVRGISMLGSLVTRNQVKRDFQKQKFYERGGLKRKRLASERWRARFKIGFKDVTRRVSELTRKGW
ncbi:hypothetical protein BDW02DRAFT_570790 [Decorospora gaudefroyi]|uniref:Ribosomal protein S21 n=1 Tax=Decorospora gaudefroyi TaxID=184978 RepID=A0A6A5KCK1_9PLEO|nr:hypothetical protein BDW02DRAFT_570790 [Decorospora gaudefroyi]